jgi:hypothetical protein
LSDKKLPIQQHQILSSLADRKVRSNTVGSRIPVIDTVGSIVSGSIFAFKIKEVINRVLLRVFVIP